MCLRISRIMDIYHDIIKSVRAKQPLLAVLFDPDKTKEINHNVISAIDRSMASHILVGGSEARTKETEFLVKNIKSKSSLPVLLFPGDVSQLTPEADGLLFLSLISGRNPEYLIGKHVKAASVLNGHKIEVIPTGYILVENGKVTSVEKVTNTKPLSRDEHDVIVHTAVAGELLGMKLIYLEAGSGAIHSVDIELIEKVKDALNIPLIVGGGFKSRSQIEAAFTAGADMVVVGTAIEEDVNFISELQ